MCLYHESLSLFLGDIKVDILNGKGESISKLPGERGKRLLIEMKIICHGKVQRSFSSRKIR